MRSGQTQRLESGTQTTQEHGAVCGLPEMLEEFCPGDRVFSRWQCAEAGELRNHQYNNIIVLI